MKADRNAEMRAARSDFFSNMKADRDARRTRSATSSKRNADNNGSAAQHAKMRTTRSVMNDNWEVFILLLDLTSSILEIRNLYVDIKARRAAQGSDAQARPSAKVAEFKAGVTRTTEAGRAEVKRVYEKAMDFYKCVDEGSNKLKCQSIIDKFFEKGPTQN